MRKVFELDPTAYSLPWGWNSAQRTAWTSSRDVTATNLGLPVPLPPPFTSASARGTGCKQKIFQSQKHRLLNAHIRVYSVSQNLSIHAAALYWPDGRSCCLCCSQTCHAGVTLNALALVDGLTGRVTDSRFNLPRFFNIPGYLASRGTIIYEGWIADNVKTIVIYFKHLPGENEENHHKISATAALRPRCHNRLLSNTYSPFLITFQLHTPLHNFYSRINQSIKFLQKESVTTATYTLAAHSGPS